MSDPEQDLARVRDRYAAAVFAKDAAALIQLYDPEVRIFDAWGHWSCEGAEAWQRAVEGWFTSLGSERVKVGFEDVKTTTGRDLSSLSAIVSYAGVSAQGETLRSMHNRLTWVLRTSGHVLRIVHEHTSAPIGFDDMKAILKR
jgi:ketosteroid isomerase-like protein